MKYLSGLGGLLRRDHFRRGGQRRQHCSLLQHLALFWQSEAVRVGDFLAIFIVVCLFYIITISIIIIEVKKAWVIYSGSTNAGTWTFGYF